MQLLDERWRRRTVGLLSGATADTAQPLLVADSTISAARSARSPTCGSRSATSPARGGEPIPRAASADADPRRYRQCRADAHDRLARWVDDGGMLVRFAGPRLAAARRRSHAGEAAPRRPHARRQPVLGEAAAARPLFARQPVRRHDRAERRDRHAPGAGRAGRRRLPTTPGRRSPTARRWSPPPGAARADRALPRHRRHALVDLPLSGTFVDMLRRIVALAGRRQSPSAPPNEGEDAARTGRRRTACSTASAGFTAPPPTARPVPADYAARATSDHPPGFYGPPENLLAVNTSSRQTIGSRHSTLGAWAAAQEVYRPTEPQDLRGPMLLAALAPVLARRAGGALARRRHGAGSAAPRAAGTAGCAVRSPRPPVTLLHGGPADAHERAARSRSALARPTSPMSSPATPMSTRPARPAWPACRVLAAAHRARSRRSDRRRPRARRARLLPADLLADRAGRAAALRRTTQAHRRLHEAGRLGAVRHPRPSWRSPGSGSEHPRPRQTGCARCCPRSTFPRSSRCRATTC